MSGVCLDFGVDRVTRSGSTALCLAYVGIPCPALAVLCCTGNVQLPGVHGLMLPSASYHRSEGMAWAIGPRALPKYTITWLGHGVAGLS